jgi:hypothetical protein
VSSNLKLLEKTSKKYCYGTKLFWFLVQVVEIDRSTFTCDIFKFNLAFRCPVYLMNNCGSISKNELLKLSKFITTSDYTGCLKNGAQSPKGLKE